MQRRAFTFLFLAVSLLALRTGAAGDMVVVPIDTSSWVVLHASVVGDDFYPVSVHSHGRDGVSALAIAYKDGIPVASVPSSLTNNTVAVKTDILGMSPGVTNSQSSGGIGAGVLLPAGEYDIVLVAGAKEFEWARYSYESPEVTISEIARGDDVFIYNAFDLDSPAHVGVSGANVLAHAGVAATAKLDIEHTFVGTFDNALLPHPAAISTVDGPEGSTSCPCRLYHASGPDRIGPGEWKFSWSGASADVNIPIIFGADVPMSWAD